MATHAHEHADAHAAPLSNTINQAATRLGIGRTLLYELIDAKELHTIKLGSRVLIPESELQRLIADRLRAARA
jgi:excisionase family DNA binding protein